MCLCLVPEVHLQVLDFLQADAGFSLSPFQVDTLCLEDLHAFIAQALCLQGKSAVQLEDLQVLP